MSEATFVETPPPAPVETPALPPTTDDFLYEVIDGGIVEIPAMGAVEGLVAARLVRLMNTSGEVNRSGLVVQEVLFVLDPVRKFQRRPDVAFVSYERWPRKRPVPPGEAWDVVPELAVEIISPTNTYNEIVGKVEDYFGAGVRLVWLIVPDFDKVYAYTSPTAVRILRADDDLDGDPVIPGFRMPVKNLFEAEDEIPAA